MFVFLLFLSLCSADQLHPRPCCQLNVDLRTSGETITEVEALVDVYLATKTAVDVVDFDKLDELKTGESKLVTTKHFCYTHSRWEACMTVINTIATDDCVLTAFGFNTLCHHREWKSYVTDWHWAVVAMFLLAAAGFFFRNTCGVCMQYCIPTLCCTTFRLTSSESGTKTKMKGEDRVSDVVGKAIASKRVLQTALIFFSLILVFDSVNCCADVFVDVHYTNKEGRSGTILGLVYANNHIVVPGKYKEELVVVTADILGEVHNLAITLNTFEMGTMVFVVLEFFNPGLSFTTVVLAGATDPFYAKGIMVGVPPFNLTSSKAGVYVNTSVDLPRSEIHIYICHIDLVNYYGYSTVILENAHVDAMDDEVATIDVDLVIPPISEDHSPSPVKRLYNKQYPNVYLTAALYPQSNQNNHIPNYRFIVTDEVNGVGCLKTYFAGVEGALIEASTGLLYTCKGTNATSSVVFPVNVCEGGISTRHFLFNCYLHHEPRGIVISIGTCKYRLDSNPSTLHTFCGCKCMYGAQHAPHLQPQFMMYYLNCACDHYIDFSALRATGACFMDANRGIDNSGIMAWFIKKEVIATYTPVPNQQLPPTSGIYRYIANCPGSMTANITLLKGNDLLASRDSIARQVFDWLKKIGMDGLIQGANHAHDSLPMVIGMDYTKCSQYCEYYSTYGGYQDCWTPGTCCVNTSYCPEANGGFIPPVSDPIVVSSIKCICGLRDVSYRLKLFGGISGQFALDCYPYIGVFRNYTVLGFTDTYCWTYGSKHRIDSCAFSLVGGLVPPKHLVMSWLMDYNCEIKSAIAFPTPPYKSDCLITSDDIVLHKDVNYKMRDCAQATVKDVNNTGSPPCVYNASTSDYFIKYPIMYNVMLTSDGLKYAVAQNRDHDSMMCYFISTRATVYWLPVFKKNGELYLFNSEEFAPINSFNHAFVGSPTNCKVGCVVDGFFDDRYFTWPNYSEYGWYCVAYGGGILYKENGTYSFVHYVPDGLKIDGCARSECTQAIRDVFNNPTLYRDFHDVLAGNISDCHMYDKCKFTDSFDCCVDDLIMQNVRLKKVGYVPYHQMPNISYSQLGNKLPLFGPVNKLMNHVVVNDTFFIGSDGLDQVDIIAPTLLQDNTYQDFGCEFAVPTFVPNVAMINSTHACMSYTNSRVQKYKATSLQMGSAYGFETIADTFMHPIVKNTHVLCTDYYSSFVLFGFCESNGATYDIVYAPIWNVPDRCLHMPPLLTRINLISSLLPTDVQTTGYLKPMNLSASVMKYNCDGGNVSRFVPNTAVLPGYFGDKLVFGGKMPTHYEAPAVFDGAVEKNKVDSIRQSCSDMTKNCIIMISIISVAVFIVLAATVAYFVWRKRHNRGFGKIKESEKVSLLDDKGEANTKKKRVRQKKSKNKVPKVSTGMHRMLLVLCFVNIALCDFQGTDEECKKKYPKGNKKDFPPYISDVGLSPYKLVGKQSDSNLVLANVADMAHFMAKTGTEYIIGDDRVGKKHLSDFTQRLEYTDFTTAFSPDHLVSGTFNCLGGPTCSCGFTFQQDTFPTLPGSVVSSAITCNNVTWPYAVRIYGRPVEYNCAHYFSTSPWVYKKCERWDCDPDCASYLVNTDQKCFNGTWEVYPQPETLSIKHETMTFLGDGCGSTEIGTQLVFIRYQGAYGSVDHVGKCTMATRDALVCLLIIDTVTCHLTKDYLHLASNLSFEIIEESDPVASIDYSVRTKDGKIVDVFLGDIGVSWTVPTWGHYGDYRFSNYYATSTTTAYPTGIDYGTAPQFTFVWDCDYKWVAYSPEFASKNCHTDINGAATKAGHAAFHHDDLIHIGGTYRETVFHGYEFDEIKVQGKEILVPVMHLDASFTPNYGHARLSFSGFFNISAPPRVYASWVSKHLVTFDLHDCRVGLSVGGNTGCFIGVTMAPGTPVMPMQFKCEYPLYCDTRVALQPGQSQYYVEVHAYASYKDIGALKINMYVHDALVGSLQTLHWELRGTESRYLQSYGMSELLPDRPGATSASGKNDFDWVSALVLGSIAVAVVISFSVALYCSKRSKKSRALNGQAGVGNCVIAALVVTGLLVVSFLGVMIYFIVALVTGISNVITAPIDTVEKLTQSDFVGGGANNGTKMLHNWEKLHTTNYSCRAGMSASYTSLQFAVPNDTAAIKCVDGCEKNGCIGYVIDTTCRYMSAYSEISKVSSHSYLCLADDSSFGISGIGAFCSSKLLMFLSLLMVWGAYGFDDYAPRGHSRGRGMRGFSRGRARGRGRGVPRGRGMTVNYFKYANEGQPPAPRPYRPINTDAYAPDMRSAVQSAVSIAKLRTEVEKKDLVIKSMKQTASIKLQSEKIARQTKAAAEAAKKVAAKVKLENTVVKEPKVAKVDKSGTVVTTGSQGAKKPTVGQFKGFTLTVDVKDVVSAMVFKANGDRMYQVQVIASPYNGPYIKSYYNSKRAFDLTQNESTIDIDDVKYSIQVEANHYDVSSMDFLLYNMFKLFPPRNETHLIKSQYKHSSKIKLLTEKFFKDFNLENFNSKLAKILDGCKNFDATMAAFENMAILGVCRQLAFRQNSRMALAQFVLCFATKKPLVYHPDVLAVMEDSDTVFAKSLDPMVQVADDVEVDTSKA